MQFVTDPYACVMYIVSPLAGGGGIVWRPPLDIRPSVVLLLRIVLIQLLAAKPNKSIIIIITSGRTAI